MLLASATDAVWRATVYRVDIDDIRHSPGLPCLPPLCNVNCEARVRACLRMAYQPAVLLYSSGSRSSWSSSQRRSLCAKCENKFLTLYEYYCGHKPAAGIVL